MGILGIVIAATAIAGAESPAKPFPAPVRALVITGGHDFERTAFFAMFDAMKDVTWTEAVQPGANTRYTPEAAREYDVLVFYDMWQDIGEEQKAQLVRAVKEDGKGVVALHHCVVSYQAWPEFRTIIGGQFTFGETTIDGKKYGPNTFDLGQTFRIRIADPADPVTKGIADFDIVDETYGGFYVASDVKPLLTVEHPKSGPVVGWSKTYGNARVVYLQSGHDHTAFENEGYRALVHNAILWTSKLRDAQP